MDFKRQRVCDPSVARENVSRVLSKWKRQNIVTWSSFYYTLNNKPTLERELES
jgi:hypothetical protein